jgi:hypothetical protein
MNLARVLRGGSQLPARSGWDRQDWELSRLGAAQVRGAAGWLMP